MEKSWDKSTPESVLTKINRVRRNLVDWAKLQTEASKDWIISHQLLLEQSLSASVPDSVKIDELKAILVTAYAEEEGFWCQRSQVQWLNAGDKNTWYFHAVTRGRRACNKFTIIEDETGCAFYEENQIVQAFVSFYNTLFTAGVPHPLDVVAEVLSPKVSPEMN